MFFKRVFTESISHFSYLIGDGGELVVIDPQADVDLYLDIAREAEMKISTILETHRNEDYLTGSRALSELTQARIYISDYEDLDYQYGERIREEKTFQMGELKIEGIHTPGHTLGHMSYLAYYRDRPYMVFSGDTLFYGDIGRTDFYGPDRLEEMSGKIYDSIFNKLLPLGDHVIMCPAHGSGSACGESIEDRSLTSLGYERKNNPKLQYDSKEEFIRANAKTLFKPDYFTYMEKMNLIGVDSLDCNPHIAVKYVEDLDLETEYIVDIRDQNAFNKFHIPNSIYIKKENILNFINWVVPREADISIVAESSDGLDKLYIDLKRIGYSGNISFLARAINSWIEKHEVERIASILPREYSDKKNSCFILDVRKKSETDADYGDKGRIMPLETISRDYEELRGKDNILVVCPTGIRSNIAASFLKSKGIEAKVLIGGLKLV